MCGISDSPWRRIVRRFGAGLVVTEMASSEALVRDRERSHQILSYQADEKPLVMQLCGSSPEVLAEATKICEDLGAAMVDLNMGCPVRKIVAQGAGSALLLDLPRTEAILKAMVKAVKIPVTLKLRSGWDEGSPVALQVARLAEDAGIAAICVHARTRQQFFSGRADWRIVKALVEATKLPVIGNGDASTPENARAMLAETGCAAVMVGRGAQGRPWIFQEILDPTFEVPSGIRHQIIREHYEDCLRFYGERKGLLVVRKHLAWYARGLRHGSSFREKVMTLSDPKAVLEQIDCFFGDGAAVEFAAAAPAPIPADSVEA